MNRIFALALLVTVVVTSTLAKDERSEKNKAIVRKVFIDIWSQGKYEVANEIYAKDFVNHGADKDISFEQDQADIRGWRPRSRTSNYSWRRCSRRVTL